MRLKDQVLLGAMCATLLLGLALPSTAQTHEAMNAPDKFAWEVFAKICAPANNGANDCIWETWATDEDTFPTTPVAGQPPTWPAGGARAKRLTASRQLELARQHRRRFGHAESPRISEGGGQEVRRNKPAFDFIVTHDLWHLDGLIAAFQRGDSISFPVEAIEIKATWKRIAESDKPKYHWNVDSSHTLYGLTGLHITTKDLPNWFWATFEHVDNPQRGQAQGCHDDFGATPPNACNGAPSQALLALFAAAGLPDAWQNYRLVDSQVDFTDATGRPLIDGNSIIEGGFENSSSCVTCHARSAVDSVGDFLDVFKPSGPLEGYVGTPDPAWYWNTNGARKAMQVDFVWGFLAAQPLSTPVQPTLAPVPATARNFAEGNNQLSRQEAQASILARRSSSVPSADELQAAAVSASAFAEKVGGADDAKVVQVFHDAMAAAFAVPSALVAQSSAPSARINAATPAGVEAATEPAVDSIFTDPRYIRNARRFLGEIRVRIVGGAETSEFPDCVAVGSGNQFCCSGTLIAPNVVVTAGHCFGSCAARVFVGTNVDDPSTGQVYQVLRAVQHPDYRRGGQQNDLTVLILDRDVPGVTPRKIASSPAIDDAYYVRAVGFGAVDFNGMFGYGKKRQVELPIATAACADSGDSSRYGCDGGLELVAGRVFSNQDSCSGDSGGPAYIVVNGEWLLGGATSRATSESIRTCGDGGVYVRVDKYVDWIKSVPGGHWQ